MAMSSYILLVLPLLLVLAVESAAGGCAAYRCCQGRNDTCFTQEEAGRNKAGKRTCYCDSTCAETNDCCSDHKEACKPKDCKVTYPKWGSCSTTCGIGRSSRKGKVVVAQQNAGKPCPQLVQHTRCMERKGCKVQRGLRRKEARETGKIIPAHHGNHRDSKKYSMRKDIRKNLFFKYHTNEVITRQTYCNHYTVMRARRTCQFAKGKHTWANTFQRKSIVCVECQPLAMKKNIGERCKGHGVYRHHTRFNAVGVYGCHGKWEMMEENHQPCRCDPNDNIDDFIFV